MLKKVDVMQLIAQEIRKRVDDLVQQKDDEGALAEIVYEEIKANELIITDDVLKRLVYELFHQEVNRRIRALPNPHEQLELFAKQQCEQQFMRYEDGDIGRMEYAKKKEVLARREHQIKHMRNQNRAFEREERVREKVLPLMDDDTVTYGMACRQLKMF